jgi:hypothetical protein
MTRKPAAWGVPASDVGKNVGRVAEGETAYRPGPGSDVDRLRLDASYWSRSATS